MTAMTITAIFDSAADAENGRRRLESLGIAENDIRILNQDPAQSGHADHKSLWESIKEFFVADEDRSTYSEGLRRGGYLLTAVVEERYEPDAVQALEDSGAVDLDRRADEWRSSGWSESDVTTDNLSTDTGAADIGNRAGMSSAAQTSAQQQSAQPSRASEEETVPVVEERLRVGKRAVNRGTVRVRSYIVEEPVHEEVQLRGERVEVERQPVSSGSSARSGASGADLLQERTIEMTESSEEPVVQKEAVVTEEVVVKKFTGERTEGIDDTVRRTEVEVDDSRGEASRDDVSADDSTDTTDPASRSSTKRRSEDRPTRRT